MSEATSFETAIANFGVIQAQVQKEMEEARKRMQDAAQKTLGEVFQAFFAAFPEVRTIHWSQYTPYFNDGEPCTFSVGEVYFSPREHEDLSGPYDGEDAEPHERDFNAWGRDPKPSKALDEAMNQLGNLINSMEDSLQDIFGDHVYVQAHRGGFEVSEHDHD